MCPSGKGQLKRSRGSVDIDTYKKFIADNRRSLINIILHFQGEPLICQHLGEMISFARANGIHTMFSTNGQLLAQSIGVIQESKPDHIIVSLDGLSNETYSKYRVGGNVQNIYDGLNALSQLPKKDRPYIELQFLVFSHNEHEINDLYKLKKKYCIDKITLKTAQIYDKSQSHFLPKNRKYLRYNIDDEGNIQIKKKQKNKCRRAIFGSVVCFDGNVVPCCFDKDAFFKFGNINNTSLREIRKSEEFRIFIKKVFTNRNGINICNNCTE